MPPNEASSFDLPHPMLTKIGDANTEPTFTTILVTHIKLNAKAALVYSTRGYGLLGHPTLSINAINCVSQSKGNINFDAPVNPPSVPVHKDKATKAEIAEENRQKKARRLEFVLWHNVNAVLSNLLITAVPDIFITAKNKPVTGFGNVTCLKLLTHLHDTYDQMKETELEDNTTCIQNTMESTNRHLIPVCANRIWHCLRSRRQQQAHQAHHSPLGLQYCRKDRTIQPHMQRMAAI
jgi:hypothetical protein